MFSATEVCNLAIQIEKNGELFYRDAIKKFPDPTLVSLLEWLADEEAKHEEWFAQLRDRLKEESLDPELEEMGRSMLRDILGDQSFSLKEADFSKLKSLEALLDLAIEFEKDTILFYEMIGAFVEKVETSGHLAEIIDEENRHVQLLEEFKSDPSQWDKTENP